MKTFINRKTKLDIAKRRIKRVKSIKLRKRLLKIVSELEILITSMEIEELLSYIAICEEEESAESLGKAAKKILKSVDLNDEREDTEPEFC